MWFPAFGWTPSTGKPYSPPDTLVYQLWGWSRQAEVAEKIAPPGFLPFGWGCCGRGPLYRKFRNHDLLCLNVVVLKSNLYAPTYTQRTKIAPWNLSACVVVIRTWIRRLNPSTVLWVIMNIHGQVLKPVNATENLTETFNVAKVTRRPVTGAHATSNGCSVPMQLPPSFLLINCPICEGG